MSYFPLYSAKSAIADASLLTLNKQKRKFAVNQLKTLSRIAIAAPYSSYFCRFTHICLNADKLDKIDPPDHTNSQRLGGAAIRIFMAASRTVTRKI